MFNFEHRDFFARNLVQDASGSLSLLDAWSGGPSASARFSMRDVAGFLADAQDVLRAAIEASVPIAGFTPEEARLRDVFVSLVGEAEAADLNTPQETNAVEAA
jgi:hypothetical protein